MDSFFRQAGEYHGNVEGAARRAGILNLLIPAGWFCYPVAVTTVLHPSDAIGFQYWMQGLAVPRAYSSQMLLAGELAALVALVALSLFQLGATVLFYRRALFVGTKVADPTLWPLPGIAAGVLGNGLWWIATGYFDALGMLVGLTSLALTVGCELVCEHLGHEFVLGQRGSQPSNPWA